MRLLIAAALLVPPCLASNADSSRLEERVRELERVVIALQARLDAVDGRGGPAPAVAARVVPSAPAPPARARNSATPDDSKRINFSGEFRVYFDSLTRPAGGGAPRVSNIRGRYLLHL